VNALTLLPGLILLIIVGVIIGDDDGGSVMA